MIDVKLLYYLEIHCKFIIFQTYFLTSIECIPAAANVTLPADCWNTIFFNCTCLTLKNKITRFYHIDTLVAPSRPKRWFSTSVEQI